MANQPGGPASPAPQAVPAARVPDARSAAPGGRRALIGGACAVRGQLSAREDVWIEGQFEGEIQAPAHQVTVSQGGRVRGGVKSRSVIVEGELLGDVVAEQSVTVRAGGRMQGDILAPRVGLEEGCQFQGKVDMDGTRAAAPPATPTEAPADVPAAVLAGERES
jgi:cytoskeletal protein CcmA (bactofilin family)